MLPTFVNPLESRGASNNMKLVYWPLMGGLLHLVQQGGDWAGPSPPRPLLAVRNVTAHPSTASVPITVLLYNSTLLCSFNSGFKGLIATLKPQSNGPSYSNTVIGTLAVDRWAVTFGTARGLGRAPARPGPSSLYQK